MKIGDKVQSIKDNDIQGVVIFVRNGKVLFERENGLWEEYYEHALEPVPPGWLDKDLEKLRIWYADHPQDIGARVLIKYAQDYEGTVPINWSEEETTILTLVQLIKAVLNEEVE
jgi:hypothetical protein